MVRQLNSPTPSGCASQRLPGALLVVQKRTGVRLGKYQIGELIGTGGMGTVYEAEDTFLKRKVAIKVLPDSVATDADAIRKFVLEARAFARVNHPNAVMIFEVNRHDGVAYLVMELMRGGSMQECMDAHGALDWPEATQAILDACRALVATHAADLVHRDIKPANLMRSSAGVVKLADFGLAKDATVQCSVSSDGTGSRVVGTPHYMSPEQCRGERVDERGDLYSLGATYYALLTGRPPYEGQLSLQVLFAHCSADVPDPCDINAEIPEACAGIVRRCMAKDPSDRYQSAAEMLADLESSLRTRSLAALYQDGDFGPGSGLSENVLAELAGALASTQTPAEYSSRPRSITTRSAGRRRSPWFWISLQGVIAAVAVGCVWIGARLHLFGPPAVASYAVAPTPVPRQPIILRFPVDPLFNLNSPQKSSIVVAPTTAPTTAPAPKPKPFGGRVTADGWGLFVGRKAESLAFSYDGSRLAVGSFQGISQWNVENGNEIDAPWRVNGTLALRYSPNSPDKKTLIAAGTSGIALRDGGSEWERHPFAGTALGAVRSVTTSRDGRLLAAAFGWDVKHQSIRVWTMADGRETAGPRSYPGSITALDFSRDGKMFAVGTSDGAELFEVADWKLLKEHIGDGPVKALSFSPDGKALAVGGNAGASLWDIRSWTQRLKASGAEVTCIAFSPDGKLLTGGRTDGTVQIWDAATGKEFRALPAQGGTVTALAFLPRTRIIAIGGAPKLIRLFDLAKPAGPEGPRPPA